MTIRPDALSVLQDKQVRKSLARYFDVMENDKPAKFLIAKKLPANFEDNDTPSELWETHNQLTKEFYKIEKEINSRQKNLKSWMKWLKDDDNPEKSYLDLKIKIANHVLESCHFCTRRCGINRIAGDLGYCRCGSKITISTMFEHIGEEPELVPSGTIFTLGCTIRCRHCQNWTISQWIENGEIYTPQRLTKSIEGLRKGGCRNVNLVGGEPTPWLPWWLETFKHVQVNIPIVWNSNSYYSVETAKILSGFVDVYLLDFKYGTDECAERLSDAQHYWESCTRNHVFGKKYGEIIIRVLILPGHLECCTKVVLNWIAQNLGKYTRTNIMFQYRPEWKAYEVPELRGMLTENDKEEIIKMAKEARLKNYICS